MSNYNWERGKTKKIKSENHSECVRCRTPKPKEEPECRAFGREWKKHFFLYSNQKKR